MPEHPFDLSGKSAIVTGASRGLGSCFARALTTGAPRAAVQDDA